jgi:23S rRNA (uracil1939-C5)-methyltransferase
MRELSRGSALTALRVEDMNSRGEGIARLDGGFVLFLPGALPGETVHVRIAEVKKQYAVGDVTGLDEAHPSRVTPCCPWFARCGGCQLQHASEPLQLELKRNLALQAMRRIGHLASEEDVPECRKSPLALHYRNKAAFPVVRGRGALRTGFYRRGSHEVVPVDRCPVLDETLETLYGTLRDLLPQAPFDGYDEKTHRGHLRHLVLRRGTRSGCLAAILVCRTRPDARQDAWIRRVLTPALRALDEEARVAVHVNDRRGNVIWGGDTLSYAGGERFTEGLGDRLFSFDLTSFSQVNTLQAEQLYAHVAEEVQTLDGRRILELYAGAGTLTAFLADRAETVTAVEEWTRSVENGRENMRALGLDNVLFTAADAGAFLRDALPGGFDTVVLDPPRGGCDEEVVRNLLRLAPRNLVYVSCKPATLFRDLALLTRGGYRFLRLRLFDMFPQTAHVECVATLRRP